MARLKSTMVTKRVSLPLTNAVVAPINGAAFIDTSTGLLTIGQASTTLKFIGWFDRFPTSPGADSFTGDGTQTVEVELLEEIELWGWDNDANPDDVTAADIGSEVYVKDASTVSTDSTSRSSAGVVVFIDPDDGRVYTYDGFKR